MRNQWIWLPKERYPQKQKTPLSRLTGQNCNYCVAELERTYQFQGRPVRSVSLKVSGDTAFLLFCGSKQLVRGPASVGGDFLYNEDLRPEYYATELMFTPEEPLAPLRFRALVRMGSVRICEYSRGEGGFCLSGKILFSDGGTEEICSDDTWTVRLLGAYQAPGEYDGSVLPDPPVRAERKEPLVKLCTAPIPPCEEHVLPLENDGVILLDGPGTSEARFPLDMIYACYLNVFFEGEPAEVEVSGYELDEAGGWRYCLRFSGDSSYYGMELYSAGGLRVRVRKTTCGLSRIRVELRASHYPIGTAARTVTSDDELNHVTDVCAHALKYCRQTLHLDSPKHCEPLACTGDYYIETLMTAFTYGDLRLAAFDVRRTANLLRQHRGEMFHTSYSLIWPLMLRDVYQFTGDIGILRENEDALDLLLARFAGYIGDNGLLEKAPNYMFVDWLVPDGINLHHPPKALGQTCLCMFCFGALRTAAEIYSVLGRNGKASEAQTRASALRSAMLRLLWDEGKGLFFEGLNTPTLPELIGKWMPENVEKRYYRKHSNILAAYFGVFDEEENRRLLRKIIFNRELGEVQPYFQHFLLDAVYRNGLREEYTLPLLDQWKPFIRDCPKGLPEGFYKPTPEYQFDHSHGWAGTPAYALPLALSGLKILEPGFRRISLSPSSLGLTRADVEIPTPFGMIRIRTGRDQKPEIEIPRGIQAVREMPADPA